MVTELEKKIKEHDEKRVNQLNQEAVNKDILSEAVMVAQTLGEERYSQGGYKSSVFKDGSIEVRAQGSNKPNYKHAKVLVDGNVVFEGEVKNNYPLTSKQEDVVAKAYDRAKTVPGRVAFKEISEKAKELAKKIRYKTANFDDPDEKTSGNAGFKVISDNAEKLGAELDTKLSYYDDPEEDPSDVFFNIVCSDGNIYRTNTAQESDYIYDPDEKQPEKKRESDYAVFKKTVEKQEVSTYHPGSWEDKLKDYRKDAVSVRQEKQADLTQKESKRKEQEQRELTERFGIDNTSGIEEKVAELKEDARTMQIVEKAVIAAMYLGKKVNHIGTTEKYEISEAGIEIEAEYTQMPRYGKVKIKKDGKTVLEGEAIQKGPFTPEDSAKMLGHYYNTTGKELDVVDRNSIIFNPEHSFVMKHKIERFIPGDWIDFVEEFHKLAEMYA